MCLNGRFSKIQSHIVLNSAITVYPEATIQGWLLTVNYVVTENQRIINHIKIVCILLLCL